MLFPPIPVCCSWFFRSRGLSDGLGYVIPDPRQLGAALAERAHGGIEFMAKRLHLPGVVGRTRALDGLGGYERANVIQPNQSYRVAITHHTAWLGAIQSGFTGVHKDSFKGCGRGPLKVRFLFLGVAVQNKGVDYRGPEV